MISWPSRLRRIAAGQLAAYLLVVGTGAVLFHRTEVQDRQSKAQRETLCSQSAQNREAIRTVYKDVAELGRSLVILRPNGDPRVIDSMNRRLAKFEGERLDQFPSLPAECRP